MILVVDDDVDVRESIIDLLEAEGYVAAGAASGHAALEFLASHPSPELILLDLMMPIMDGREFRRRQLGNPSWADIPVIALSATVAADDLLRLTGFLRKPVQVDTLLRAIQRFASSTTAAKVAGT